MKTMALPMLTVRAILLGFLLHALMQVSLAQAASYAGLSAPKCNQLLDATYDQLSEADKSARWAKYVGCRKSKADQYLRQQYSAARVELRNWESNAEIQAREQIREYGKSETNMMTARQKVEREAHQQEFDSRIASLQLQSDVMSTREFMAERAAINKERRETFTALQEQQQQEKEDLAGDIKDSHVMAIQQIEELAQQDAEALNRHYEQKVEYIEQVYSDMLDRPFEETPNETSNRIGTLVDLRGSAVVTRQDGEQIEARVGTDIFLYDRIEVDTFGEATVLLRDNREFSVPDRGPVVLDEYIYDPGTNESSTLWSVLRPVFLFMSGLVNRGEIQVETEFPGHEIGIRG